MNISIVFAVIFIMLWVVAGGFITDANVKLKGQGYPKASKWTLGIAIGTWVAIGLVVVGIAIYYFTGAGEEQAAASAEKKALKDISNKHSNRSIGGIIFLVIAFILVALDCAGSWIAFADIKTDSRTNSNIKKAEQDVLISGISTLVAILFLFIWGGVLIYENYQKKKKYEELIEEKQEVAEEREEQMIERKRELQKLLLERQTAMQSPMGSNFYQPRVYY